MKKLIDVEKNQRILAKQINDIHKAIRELQNVKVGSGLTMTRTSSGTVISVKKKLDDYNDILFIDFANGTIVKQDAPAAVTGQGTGPHIVYASTTAADDWWILLPFSTDGQESFQSGTIINAFMAWDKTNVNAVKTNPAVAFYAVMDITMALITAAWSPNTVTWNTKPATSGSNSGFILGASGQPDTGVQSVNANNNIPAGSGVSTAVFTLTAPSAIYGIAIKASIALTLADSGLGSANLLQTTAANARFIAG